METDTLKCVHCKETLKYTYGHKWISTATTVGPGICLSSDNGRHSVESFIFARTTSAVNHLEEIYTWGYFHRVFHALFSFSCPDCQVINRWR